MASLRRASLCDARRPVPKLGIHICVRVHVWLTFCSQIFLFSHPISPLRLADLTLLILITLIFSRAVDFLAGKQNLGRIEIIQFDSPSQITGPPARIGRLEPGPPPRPSRAA